MRIGNITLKHKHPSLNAQGHRNWIRQRYVNATGHTRGRWSELKIMKELIITGSFLVAFLTCCERKSDKIDDALLQADGYIVGFDPCSINHQYKIGYVIISEDLSDTIVTYNLSDSIYKMPASLLCGTDTLYVFPESYFQNYMNSAYFQQSYRYEFKIRVTYTKAKKDELNFNICSANINQSDLFYQFEHNQVIIKSALIY